MYGWASVKDMYAWEKFNKNNNECIALLTFLPFNIFSFIVKNQRSASPIIHELEEELLDEVANNDENV